MTTATGRLGAALVLAAAAAAMTGCAYTETRGHYGHSYYRHTHYLPYTDLRIGVFSSDRHGDHGHGKRHWRDQSHHYGKGASRYGRGDDRSHKRYEKRGRYRHHDGHRH